MTKSKDLNQAINSLYDALRLIHSHRNDYDARSLVNLAGAYSLKKQFAFKASDEIARNYADIIMRDSIRNPFSDQGMFDFDESHTQLAFWVDVLLHNCRGALETLGAIIDYVYDFKIKQTSFQKSLNKLQSRNIGISILLENIRNDFWFEIINQLRNKSYHMMLNNFVPKIGLGIARLRFTVYFTVKDAFGGNLIHNNAGAFLLCGTKSCTCSLELGEFSTFIATRLREYLDQTDHAIVQDCLDISRGRDLRTRDGYPPLYIPYMKLPSLRNLVDFSEIPNSLRRWIEDSE